jgi:hypothetical protein
MRYRCSTILLGLWLAWPATSLASEANRRSHPNESVASAKEVEITYFDSMEWANVYSCAAKGSYFYAAMYYGVLILDISDPTSPQPVARLPLSGPVNNIVIHGDYAYAAGAYEGIFIIDISDPLVPKLIRLEDTPGIARELVISDPYLYLADDFAGLRILDVSVPQAPTLVDSLAFPLLNRVQGIDIQGSMVLLAANQKIQLVDVSDPGHAFFAGEFITSDRAWDVVALGNYAFVADGYDAMPIVSVANPDSLEQVAHIDTQGYARRIAAADGYVYVADSWGGLKIFDVSDPLAPQAAGLGGAYAIDVSLDGNRAYTSGENQGASLFDITDPTAPALLGKYASDDGAVRLEVEGDLLFVADADDELSIFDVSDPHRPLVVGRYEGLSRGEEVRIDIEGGIAAMAAGFLEFVDISDPFHPVPAGNWFAETDGSYIQDVVLVGDTAYAVDQWYVGALDISDPSSPKVIGSGGGVSFCCIEDFEVHGRYAYVAGGSEGVRILDLTTPPWYAVVAQIGTTGSAEALTIVWPIAYVIDSDAGLVIYDIGQPDSAVPLGLQPLPWPAQSIRVAGDYAYLVHNDSGLVVVDISDPFQPEIAGSFHSLGQAMDVAVKDNVLYLADRFAMSILDVSEKSEVEDQSGTIPTDFRILQTYPNPFNASTHVTYAIDRAGKANFSVYNTLGQRVRTLVDQQLTAGEHSQIWDGRGDHGNDMATGVYFFVLQVGTQTDVRKALLLK